MNLPIAFVLVLLVCALVIIAVGLMWFTQPVHAQESDAAADESGALKVYVLNSGPYACDNSNPYTEVQLGAARIRKILLWIGQDMGGRSDIPVSLMKVNPDGSMDYVFKTGWDHYAEPTGIQGQTLWFDFAPDYVRLKSNQTLRLYHGCNNWGDPTRAHVIVTVYYLGKTVEQVEP